MSQVIDGDYPDFVAFNQQRLATNNSRDPRRQIGICPIVASPGTRYSFAVWLALASSQDARA